MARIFSNQAALDRALDQVVDEILGAFVDRAAEHAQDGARVDTHFYQEHIKGIPPNSPGLPPDLDVRVDSRLTLRSYYAPGVDGTQSGEALIVGQADYSIYVELLDNTIYTAAVETIPELPSLASPFTI